MSGPFLEAGSVVYIPVEILEADEFTEDETYKVRFCDNHTEWVSHTALIAAMKEADNVSPEGSGPNRALRRELIENEIARLHRELEEIS